MKLVKGERGQKLKKVVTFGEIMLRLAPNGFHRFFQDNTLNATFGGAEANVAVSLANFGLNSTFVTVLPPHDIGQAAVNSLRYFGVDTSSVIRNGERIGIYYCEKGASQRASKVIYDRAHSAFAEAKPDEFDWDSILNDVDWFHFTGITPALGGMLQKICLNALETAKNKGIFISCDLNYRKKLWSREQAHDVMTKLAKYVDICIANEEDAKDVFGIEAEDTDIVTGKINREGYEKVARRLTDEFNFKAVAFTLRTSLSASDNLWSGILYSNGDIYVSKEYALRIVDRVGGGDSFGAGLIYTSLMGYSPQETIEFAVAASCLKHSVEGDFNRMSVNEVLTLMNGDASGRVQR
jgi:2-dehydro-3-deoxygluconokinase